jgi:hypothetical protein
MAKYSKNTLMSWTKPPSDIEQTKLETSERMVREAIREDETLSRKSTETFIFELLTKYSLRKSPL